MSTIGDSEQTKLHIMFREYYGDKFIGSVYDDKLDIYRMTIIVDGCITQVVFTIEEAKEATCES